MPNLLRVGAGIELHDELIARRTGEAVPECHDHRTIAARGDHQVAGSGTAAAQSQLTAAFVQRLRELGWTEGRNVAIEYRSGEGRTERFAELQASSHKPAAVDHQN